MISLFEFYDRNSNYNPQLLNMDKVKYKDSAKLLGIEIDNQLKHTFYFMSFLHLASAEMTVDNIFPEVLIWS